MVFIVYPNKTVKAVAENINVGDTATQLVVVSPFSGIQTVSFRYKLPTGEEKEPAFTTYSEGYDLGDGYNGHVYVMYIPSDMTETPGTVQASIVFTDASAQQFVSDTVTIEVGGVESLPFPDNEEQGADFGAVLEALLAEARAFINDYNKGAYDVETAQEAAREAVSAAEKAERSAEIASEAANGIGTAVDEAKQAATEAKQAAQGVDQYASAAETAASQAAQSASEAALSESNAAASEASASQSASDAEQAKTQAAQSATTAEQAATQATQAAGSASANAQAASQSAADADSAAGTASQAAADASSAENSANNAANRAEQAKTDSETARTQAEGYAAASRSSAAASSTFSDSAKTAAEAAENSAAAANSAESASSASASAAQSAATAAREAADEAQSTVDAFLDTKFPVGLVFMFNSAVNPAQIYGGTWEQVCFDRAPIGAGDTYSVGETTGAEVHRHTANGSMFTAISYSTGNGGIMYQERSMSNEEYINFPNALNRPSRINIANAYSSVSLQSNYVNPVYGYTTYESNYMPSMAFNFWARIA